MTVVRAPGTILMHMAFFEAIASIQPGRFFEVGCGRGELMERMLKRGWRGTGLEFDEANLEHNAAVFTDAIQEKRLELVARDFQAADLVEHQDCYDLVYSTMVMEHVEDDRGFLNRMIGLARPGGCVLTVVPARQDLWGIEDDLAGHFRRYERSGLDELFRSAGLQKVSVNSLGYPLTNLTLPVGNWLISRAEVARDAGKMSMEEKTKQSGRMEVSFKYRYPSVLSLLLNEVVIYPLHLLQKGFYGSNRGTMLLARGERAPE